jgi:hypothetical protein
MLSADNRRMIRRQINYGFQRIWQEAVVAYSTYYHGIFLGLSKIDINLRISGVPSQIRTEHLPNTSLDRNCYASLFVFHYNFID